MRSAFFTTEPYDRRDPGDTPPAACAERVATVFRAIAKGMVICKYPRSGTEGPLHWVPGGIVF
jgi:hypothetical protein